MTEYEMKQAVLSRILNADFIADEQVDVPNSRAFSPPDGVWMRVAFSGAAGVFAGFGDKPCTKRTGMVLIQCFVPSERYTRQLEEFAEKLTALLEWHAEQGFELHAADAVDVGETDNGAYFQKNLNIPFLIYV